MSFNKPSRFFAGLLGVGSNGEWAEQVRAVEALGYAGISLPDHVGQGFGAMPALAAAAAVSERPRLICTVFANDCRHPALLAQDGATIDVLSDGRFEFGIGAGWK